MRGRRPRSSPTLLRPRLPPSNPFSEPLSQDRACCFQSHPGGSSRCLATGLRPPASELDAETQTLPRVPRLPPHPPPAESAGGRPMSCVP